jgi:ABC-type sugar transport system permease subunit
MSGASRAARGGLRLQQRRAWYGRLFILPWLIGFAFFFAVPFAQSFYYTFTKFTISGEGLSMDFVGLDNYVYALTKDPAFVRTVVSSVGNIVYQVPIIFFFSLFVAMLLKRDFRGRSLMRAIFFFPVIISSGVVITILRENVLMDPAAVNADGGEISLFQAGNIRALLVNSGLYVGMVDRLVAVISQIFDLTWKSGVQTLMILSALHGIPSSMYEAADIEGATGWEKFWKITFPLISPTTLLAVIYSIIDYFTDYGNQVMRMIVQYTRQGRFEYSTTIGIAYFLLVMALIALVNAFLAKRVFYMNE